MRRSDWLPILALLSPAGFRVWTRVSHKPRTLSEDDTLGATRFEASRLAMTVYDLPPGQAICPYHFHWGDEEWLVVVSGTPTVRTPNGEQTLEPGDVVCFLVGPEGAHRVHNASDNAARVALFSNKHEFGIIEYPDSDKIGVWGRHNESLDHVIRAQPGPRLLGRRAALKRQRLGGLRRCFADPDLPARGVAGVRDAPAARSARTQLTKLGVLLSAGMSELSGSARRPRTRMTLQAGPHIGRPSPRLGPLPLWKPHCAVTRCGPYTKRDRVSLTSRSYWPCLERRRPLS